MRGLKSAILKFWRDEEGQTTTEYILILSVVVLIALKLKGSIQGILEGLLGKVENNLNDFN